MSRRDRTTLLAVVAFALAGTTVSVAVQAWAELLAGWSGLAVSLLAWWTKGR